MVPLAHDKDDDDDDALRLCQSESTLQSGDENVNRRSSERNMKSGE